ncbi:MAG TPA: CARDB domain-containing protein, partial [Anaerolineae bacterium]|nr:CARDB domain-containing protein [Anaerolineae bacterium]
TGAAKCWGQDYSGELGIGSTTMGVMVNSPQDVVGLSSGGQAIAAGLQYTCAIVNGAAKCWGNNDYGQLGNGTTTDANTPVNVTGLSSGVTAIAVVDRGQGDEHSCAVVNGAAKCWGYNYAGALGNGQKGDATPVTTPVDVVGLSANVTDIAAGADHSCAIVGGSVKCWGFSYYGQLGNGTSGTYDIYPSPVNVIGLPAGATKIVAGNNFNCAIVNGGVWCWGDNEQGQLGSPAWPNLSATPIQASGLESGVTALAATRTKVCAIKEGILYCWGDGQPVPLQNSLYNATYTDVAVSGDVTCVVGATDAVCGGTNVNGKLGDGRVNERLTPVPVLGLKPGPELYMHYAAARPGSLLHITVANAPAWTNVPISLNGQLLGTGQANQYGYFRAVLNTTGALPGYYRVHVLVNGAPLEAAFTLDNAAPLRSLEGGGSAPGILFDMVGGVATPTPAPATPIPPTPTPIPGVVKPAPVINQVFPNQGAADQPAQVEIYGANFQDGAVARLEPGGIPALRTIYNSSTHLSALWPGALAARMYDVSVTNPDWSRGTLNGGYMALNIDPSLPSVADDLHGFNYELTSNQVYEYVGQATWVWFVVHRLGGDSVLNDVRVRFYVGTPGLTDPAAQATYIGEGSIAALPPNGHFPVNVPWTPQEAGTFELYAVIDPAKTVVEVNEANNVYHRWVQVKVLTPPDTSPPVVDAVTAPVKTSSGSVVLSITAHDVGDSGLAWMDFVVWEYFPSVRAWLVTDETGWMPYDSVYWYSFGYFSGPRYIDVWVADAARNISAAPGSALVNYLKPDNFIMQGESHLYLFPLAQSAAFSSDMRFRFTFDDADLYLWPPDYPSRP